MDVSLSEARQITPSVYDEVKQHLKEMLDRGVIRISEDRVIMPSYKLTYAYFHGQGRGEVARMLFKLGGIEFEDVRVTRDEWTEMKKSDKTPFGQLPILEIDGEPPLCQSAAICYRIATDIGKAGTNEKERSRAIMIARCVDDCMTRFPANEADMEKRKMIRKKYCTDDFPPILKKFEAILQSTENVFFLGNEITWPDIAVYQLTAGLKLFDFVEENFPVLEDICPNLATLIKKVQMHAVLGQYINDRPKTNF